MGLFQKAVETYDCFRDSAGVYFPGQSPLAPISHIVTRANIEITLNRDGAFLSARAVDKNEPKTIIPVTESSAGRSSNNCPHPLCDQLAYLASYDEKSAIKQPLYIQQLQEWAESPYSHPMLKPILTYVSGGTILQDLAAESIIALEDNGAPKKPKLLVRWVVNGLGEDSGSCHTNQKLFDAFIRFYESKQPKDKQVLCMVTGKTETPAEQHPKGVISQSGNAKLISAQDHTGFTYRGRFSYDTQAVTVGYAASQKAHNALRWVADNHGVRRLMPGDTAHTNSDGVHTVFGERTFLCWNPQGKPIFPVTGVFARSNSEVKREFAPYKEALQKTLSGFQTTLNPEDDVVIAAFDAATAGRLSVTYYNELRASDFLARLYHWDLTCCFENGKFGIQSPSLFRLVCCAYGTFRSGEFIKPNKAVLRQQMQRLIACRIDRAPFPYDLERRLVQKASNLQLYKKSDQKPYDPREELLFCTCAAIQKLHYDHDTDKEKWNMQTDLNTKDRSFQFGRLLAVLEKAEQDYYRRTGETSGDGKAERETNAIRMMPMYCNRPWSTYESLNKKLRTAYLPRVQPWQKAQYLKRTDEIITILTELSGEMLNAPLRDTYLLGYHLQRKAFYTKKENDTAENPLEEEK